MTGRGHFRRCGMGLGLCLGICSTGVSGQTETHTVQPYATMDREKVTYLGVGRESGSDLKGDSIKIGILLPLSGVRAQEGKQLLQAAQLAVDEENKRAPLGKRFELALQDADGQWGQSSNALIHLIMQDESVALITSTDGSIAHQAEQIANKIGIPVVTLSSDATTTQTNIPWIFRVGPSDLDQANAIASHIYGVSGLHKVLLVAERDHDGRLGAEEFAKAAGSYRVETVKRVEIDAAAGSSISSAVEEMRIGKAEAVVLWTSPGIANQLIPVLGVAIPSTPIYLSGKAAGFQREDFAGRREPRPLLFTVSEGALVGEFGNQYLELTDTEPGIAAWQMDDAVRTIANAVRQTGTNRARVRDYLAATGLGESTGSVISFDSSGNVKSKVIVVNLKPFSEEIGLPIPK